MSDEMKVEVKHEDRVRFMESSYNHVRQEMIEHIKFRRATCLSAIVMSAALFAWLWKDGTEVGLILNFLKVTPVFVVLVGFFSSEATNLKISKHIEYLRMVEKQYEEKGGFQGFEKFYYSAVQKPERKEGNERNKLFITSSEKVWTRVLMSMALIVVILISIGIWTHPQTDPSSDHEKCVFVCNATKEN